MQQTETYKLNLIESSDPFSPAALNENTQKLEEVVSGKLEDMDQRVTVLEAKKFTRGSYKGTGIDRQFIQLPFTPIAVLIHLVSTNYSSLALQGMQSNDLLLAENGFYAILSGQVCANTKQSAYYLAFG